MRSSPPAGGVVLAGVADEDRLLLDGVAALAAGGAGVDGVAVVEAAADGVALDDLEAHARGCLAGGGWEEGGGGGCCKRVRMDRYETDGL